MRCQNDQDLEARTIKNFVDILILKYLREHPLVSCYEIQEGENPSGSSFSKGKVVLLISSIAIVVVGLKLAGIF